MQHAHAVHGQAQVQGTGGAYSACGTQQQPPAMASKLVTALSPLPIQRASPQAVQGCTPQCGRLYHRRQVVGDTAGQSQHQQCATQGCRQHGLTTDTHARISSVKHCQGHECECVSTVGTTIAHPCSMPVGVGLMAMVLTCAVCRRSHAIHTPRHAVILQQQHKDHKAAVDSTAPQTP